MALLFCEHFFTFFLIILLKWRYGCPHPRDSPLRSEALAGPVQASLGRPAAAAGRHDGVDRRNAAAGVGCCSPPASEAWQRCTDKRM